MPVSTGPQSDNSDEAKGMMGGFPRGQRAFKCSFPSPEWWGTHYRSSIPGLVHPHLPRKTYRAPHSLPLESSRVPGDTLALPRPTPRPLSPEPRCFQSLSSAAAAAAAAPLQHPSPPSLSPVAGGSRSTSSVLTARQSLGARGFWVGFFFVYTVCVCAHEYVCAKRSSHPSAQAASGAGRRE